MTYPSRFFKTGLFPARDRQVTFSNASQSRSESSIAINPLNADNLIAASKKFYEPAKYKFTLSTSYSFDGGLSWAETPLPLQPGWQGLTDPALAFDGLGSAFLVAEPIKWVTTAGKEDIVGMGMYVYKSTDGGQSWAAAVAIHPDDASDDKQWVACDNSVTSPFFGRVYAAWGASSPLRFARSLDHGQTWKGRGNEAAGSMLAPGTFAPEISVGEDGTIHIVWHPDGSTTINYMRSTDGGETFGPVQTIVDDVQSLRGHLPMVNQWPHFPGASFRVITLATGCTFASGNVMVAWSDYREGAARIYTCMSDDSGATWQGLKKGQPLLGTGAAPSSLHHFHPQLIATRNGVVGCAFYEFGPKLGSNLIDVQIAASFDDGKTFGKQATVTDQPWDPAVNAPFSHGDPAVTFIGEYFGLDADEDSFAVLWTDTRTGVQELFFDRVGTEQFYNPFKGYEQVGDILFGITTDGGGVIVVNGRIIRVPPRGPYFDIVHALAALESSEQIRHPAGRELQRGALRAIELVARDAAARLGKTRR